MILDAHLDEIAAAADALQNILDVVRERGDGLADGGEALGLHHLLVVIRIFDGQRRLVGDGNHKFEMLLREFVGRALLKNPLRRDRGVDVDDAVQVDRQVDEGAGGVARLDHSADDQLPDSGPGSGSELHAEQAGEERGECCALEQLRLRRTQRHSRRQTLPGVVTCR